MTKILLIGPFPNPISGVSLANKVVQEVLEESDLFKPQIIDTSYPIFEDAVGSFSIKKILFFLKINLKFIKILKNDIIYLTPGQTFFGITKYTLFILLSALLKKELIIHVHGNYLATQYNQLSGIKKKIFYFLVSKFTKGIVLSASLKTNLTPFINKNKIFVLHNFAENYLSVNKVVKPVDKLRITYLSNLMEEKGILYLLESLKELEVLNIPYEAKIAGNIDAALKKEIETKINHLKNTTYLGLVFKNDKKELLNWSNIFVLPTFYKMEGQPISILEAMATKNLIITTKHAGIPDIIKEGINGYFVEKESSKSILKSLKFLNENKSNISEIGNNNKMYFADNYTVKRFSKEIIKILKAN